jgi:hypothetical protein
MYNNDRNPSYRRQYCGMIDIIKGLFSNSILRNSQTKVFSLLEFGNFKKPFSEVSSHCLLSQLKSYGKNFDSLLVKNWNFLYLFFGRICTKLYFRLQIFYRVKSEYLITITHKIIRLINDSANRCVCQAEILCSEGSPYLTYAARRLRRDSQVIINDIWEDNSSRLRKQPKLPWLCDRYLTEKIIVWNTITKCTKERKLSSR